MPARSRFVPSACVALAARLLLCLAVAVPHLTASAARKAPQPTPEETKALAEAFVQTAGSRRIALADGTLGWLIAPPEQEADARAFLTPQRVAQAFDAITEAGAWPSTWLVVRDVERDIDLAFTVELVDGRVVAPQAAFVVARRTWTSSKDAEQALLAVRGDRLARRPKEVVLVEFTMKTETTYVYQVSPPDAVNRGLMSLLPQGTLLRAARALDLGDGTRRTLALVLQDAVFEPSDCASCESAVFGHADSGKVLLVLAGETAIEDQVDLTPMLRGTEGKPLLPRFACATEDRDPARASLPVAERFANRESVTLLDLRDLDRDGAALEFTLPARFVSCDRLTTLVVGVDPKTMKLVARSEESAQAAPATGSRP